MITLFQAFVAQLKLTWLCAAILWFMYVFKNDTENIIPEVFENKYFILSMSWFWFIGGTWFRYYFQMPEYGVWSYLFEYDPYLAGLVLGVVIIMNVKLLTRS